MARLAGRPRHLQRAGTAALWNVVRAARVYRRSSSVLTVEPEPVLQWRAISAHLHDRHPRSTRPPLGPIGDIKFAMFTTRTRTATPREPDDHAEPVARGR